MKKLLFLLLDHGEIVGNIFKELSQNGFNATVLNARSIKHLLEDEESEDIHFFNISHLNKNLFATSTFCYFIEEENDIGKLKDLIRQTTDSFKAIKGAMFTCPIDEYEGTI